ncbi:TIGR03749 family integrating conjugative element protein [Xanthomonas oryzae pv. oryzicola]|uniref:TIGR03749 family integrating conjugative element protein n=1 Tax=Xanthomonas oryzae TaxID=347 RepID=UPI000B41CE01|nr:TIGR03749 family integrating conjugative element protein [Xanthomonas oryzae]OWB31477.1 integrating conjugative element protein [Xanthomonas oryzae pv. oryzicola]
MTRLVPILALGIFLLLGRIPTAHALQILRWERLPLAVALHVGEERVVFIDRNVRIGVPTAIADRLRVQSAGGAIYLKASEAFEATRLELQDADSGALILLDIAAEPAKHGETPLEPLRIVQGDAPASRYGERAHTSNDDTDTADATEVATAQVPQAATVAPRRTPIAVALTRYAAQNLYAPLRTVEPVPGVSPTPVNAALNLDSLAPALPLEAHPLAAWRLEDQWVTAVRLTNTSPRWIDLDPRTLMGDFVAATFQHPGLGPAGDVTDTSVLYVLTRGRSLADALLPKLNQIDAAQNLPPVSDAKVDAEQHARAAHEK